MRKIVIWGAAWLVVVIALYLIFKPEKDYKQLAIGEWEDKANSIHATVARDTINFRHGTQTRNVFYELHVDRTPMEIEVWLYPDKKETYRGTIVFKSDDEVISKKLPGAEDKKYGIEDLVSQMAAKWERKK